MKHHNQHAETVEWLRSEALKKDALKHAAVALTEWQALATRNHQLQATLLRMLNMHHLMMSKIDHGKSWYDADCLREMNQAPSQARKVLQEE